MITAGLSHGGRKSREMRENALPGSSSHAACADWKEIPWRVSHHARLSRTQEGYPCELALQFKGIMFRLMRAGEGQGVWPNGGDPEKGSLLSLLQNRERGEECVRVCVCMCVFVGQNTSWGPRLHNLKNKEGHTANNSDEVCAHTKT